MDELFLILQGIWYLFVFVFITANSVFVFLMLKGYLEVRKELKEERQRNEAFFEIVEEFHREFE